MDLFDQIALWGRKYERQVNPRIGGYRFTLTDLLQRYDRNALLEMTPYVNGKAVQTYRPDPIRKLKLSLLDEGVSSLGAAAREWFEIYETPPSGDYARVRIVSLLEDPPGCEIRMLIAQRNPDLYFQEDPIFNALAAHAGSR